MGEVDQAAFTAAAHKLARLICTLLTEGQEYTDRGQDYDEEHYRERVLRSLSQRAAKLGMRMIPLENQGLKAEQSQLFGDVFLKRCKTCWV